MNAKTEDRSRQRTSGAPLAYWSPGPMTATVRQEIVRAADALAARHDWWAQPLRLEETEDGGLGGKTELMLVGYERETGEMIEVDPDDDAFMGWMDLCVIVDWLCGQSEATGTTWTLEFGGERLGEIRDGHEDDPLEAFVFTLGQEVGAHLDERDDELAEAIDQRHAGRR